MIGASETTHVVTHTGGVTSGISTWRSVSAPEPISILSIAPAVLHCTKAIELDDTSVFCISACSHTIASFEPSFAIFQKSISPPISKFNSPPVAVSRGATGSFFGS
jgi:hypothetical protein